MFRSPRSFVALSLVLFSGCVVGPAGTPTPTTTGPTAAGASATPGDLAGGPASPGCSAPDSPAQLAEASVIVDHVEGCFEANDGWHSDTDAYLFDVTGDRTRLVTITVHDDDPSVHADLSLMLGNDLQEQCLTSMDQHTCVIWLISEPGVRLGLTVWGSVGSKTEVPYSIDVALTDVPDYGEPNEDADHAAPIASGATIEASLLDRLKPDGKKVNDVDYYRVTATQAGTLRVRLTFEKRMDPVITVTTAAGKSVGELRPEDRSGDQPFEGSLEVAAGDYILHVGQNHYTSPRPMTNDGPAGRFPGDPYTLTVTAP